MTDASLPAQIDREPRYKVTTTTSERTGKTLRITRRVRHAIDLMVWAGLKREQAADQAGIKDNSLYVALRRPDVKAYYLSECEVLRTSGRARRIRRLEELSEQDENKAAAVAAIRALDQRDDDPSANAQRVQAPGIVIVLGTQPAPPTIEHNANPLKTHDPT